MLFDRVVSVRIHPAEIRIYHSTSLAFAQDAGQNTKRSVRGDMTSKTAMRAFAVACFASTAFSLPSSEICSLSFLRVRSQKLALFQTYTATFAIGYH